MIKKCFEAGWGKAQRGNIRLIAVWLACAKSSSSDQQPPLPFIALAVLSLDQRDEVGMRRRVGRGEEVWSSTAGDGSRRSMVDGRN